MGASCTPQAAGLSSALHDNNLIVTAGLAEVAAGSIAMGLGGYLAAKTSAEHYNNERQREAYEIEHMPEAEEQEVDDALDGKSVADMSRAKQIKSLFRMVTPHLSLKDIPMVVVNHTYKEIGMFPKDIVGGGTGSYYSADNIFIIGRQQEKEGTEIVGYNFIINVEKSRYVKEKSKIPVSVSFDGGISKWSGLLDLALESGHVIKPTNGWYSKVNKNTGEIEDKKYREKDTDTKDFWNSIITSESFNTFIEYRYRVASSEIMQGGDAGVFGD